MSSTDLGPHRQETGLEDVVYSSGPLLGSPRGFLARVATELRSVPANAFRMAVSDLRARSRRSRLGYVWMVVPALVSSLTWVYLEAAGVLRFSAPGVSYLAYVLTGTMLWQVFAEALQTPLRRLDAARQLLTKSRVPHETWVLAGLADVVLGLVARFVVVVVVLIAVGTPLTSAVLLVPLGIAGLLMLGLGLGMLLVPVGLLYEDVGRGLTVATTLLFFLTPVIYAVPDRGVIGTVVNANPVTWLLQPTRAWLIDAPASGALPFAAVTAASFALLCATTIGYRLAQPHLVARL